MDALLPACAGGCAAAVINMFVHCEATMEPGVVVNNNYGEWWGKHPCQPLASTLPNPLPSSRLEDLGWSEARG
eukprot:3816220-Rhodomonas_salina.1